MAGQLPVITWDYDFSPYGQKIRTLLKAANIPFSDVDQPVTLPRPDLKALGITYRRIPVTAIGKDVYCDSAAIVSALQRKFGGLPTHKADKAYEQFGINVFNACLPVVPKEALTPEFKKDREAMFPILSNPNLQAMRPSAVAELQSHMREIENVFLGGDAFVGGQKLSLADIHVVWSIRWLLFNLEMNKEPGCGPEHFPKIYSWIEKFPKVETDKIDAQKAATMVLQSGYSDEQLPFDEKDPLGIAKGTPVQVENSDTKPGAFPQEGKLIGLGKDELVLELDNGLHVHFPRTGYNVYKSK